MYPQQKGAWRECGDLHTMAEGQPAWGRGEKKTSSCVKVNASLAAFGGKQSQGLRSTTASLLSSRSRFASARMKAVIELLTYSSSTELSRARSVAVNPEHPNLPGVPGMGA